MVLNGRGLGPRLTRLHGSTHASTTSKAVTNSQAVTGVKCNYLIVSQVGSDLDAHGTLETARHKLREPEAYVAFARLPQAGSATPMRAPGKNHNGMS